MNENINNIQQLLEHMNLNELIKDENKEKEYFNTKNKVIKKVNQKILQEQQRKEKCIKGTSIHLPIELYNKINDVSIKKNVSINFLIISILECWFE